jgi:hypothetical protein
MSTKFSWVENDVRRGRRRGGNQIRPSTVSPQNGEERTQAMAETVKNLAGGTRRQMPQQQRPQAPHGRRVDTEEPLGDEMPAAAQPSPRRLPAAAPAVIQQPTEEPEEEIEETEEEIRTEAEATGGLGFPVCVFPIIDPEAMIKLESGREVRAVQAHARDHRWQDNQCLVSDERYPGVRGGDGPGLRQG